MSKQYANFGPTDFDKFDCVKIAFGVYLILLFILRGYLIWLMSVTNMQDRVSIIAWVYPEPKLFYLSLLSGLGGILTVFLLSLRRPGANSFIKKMCHQLKNILFIALFFDWLINLLAYYFWQMQSKEWLLINSTIIIIAVIYLYSSKRVNINVQEFPEKLPEK
ncbi:DUF2919 family protein [Thalassotalea sp. 1_MG-2023]|uniref:DUF2919 family protein n=1 Tax=Thalassotalea sp. 1_MG-2023 TaxID=3062680 RepID=UPI0026E13D7A|nr:DUF2919 family protein [Thalassotalea sp. 1_MG-2023]MDO6428292.1 DUF2919 family protein [Thalassotalea sp. 1_MG-2023]